MSTTYDIACRQHKVKLWMGQSSAALPLRIYGGEADWEAQRQFFEQHMHCPLEFGSDIEDDEEDRYKDFEPDNGAKRHEGWINFAERRPVNGERVRLYWRENRMGERFAIYDSVAMWYGTPDPEVYDGPFFDTGRIATDRLYPHWDWVAWIFWQPLAAPPTAEQIERAREVKE